MCIFVHKKSAAMPENFSYYHNNIYFEKNKEFFIKFLKDISKLDKIKQNSSSSSFSLIAIPHSLQKKCCEKKKLFTALKIKIYQ